MGKGLGCVYKHIQPKTSYLPPNLKFVMPPCLFFTSQHDITNDCGITVISHKQNLPVTNLTTTTQVDTDSNNYDAKKSVSTPRNKSHHP